MFRREVIDVTDVDERHVPTVRGQGALAANGVEVGHLGVAACGVQTGRDVRDPTGAGGVVGADQPAARYRLLPLASARARLLLCVMSIP